MFDSIDKPMPLLRSCPQPNLAPIRELASNSLHIDSLTSTDAPVATGSRPEAVCAQTQSRTGDHSETKIGTREGRTVLRMERIYRPHLKWD